MAEEHNRHSPMLVGEVPEQLRVHTAIKTYDRQGVKV